MSDLRHSKKEYGPLRPRRTRICGSIAEINVVIVVFTTSLPTETKSFFTSSLARCEDIIDGVEKCGVVVVGVIIVVVVLGVDVVSAEVTIEAIVVEIVDKIGLYP